jgi:SRP40, C-terminal domain
MTITSIVRIEYAELILFPQEKNKKKRGSYKGGNISLQSHSIKFE